MSQYKKRRVSKRVDSTETSDHTCINSESNTSIVTSNNNQLKLVKSDEDNPIVPYNSTLLRIKNNLNLKELSEEDYVSCLENIIERDYFPDLLKLRYLKAIANAKAIGNLQVVKSLEETLKKIQDGEHDINDVELQVLNNNEKLIVNLGKNGLKLDEFHQIFTSEDNRNYERLVEKDIKVKINKYKWIEDGEYKYNKSLIDIKKLTDSGIKSNELASNKCRGRNKLFFHDDKHQNYTSNVIINPKNTGLDDNLIQHIKDMEKNQTIKNKQKLQSSIDDKISHSIAIDGFTAYKNDKRDLEYESNLNNRGGYDYVHTPKIIAGKGDYTPIMTWGHVDSIKSIPSTPLNNEYTIPNVSTRDDIANELYKKLKSKQVNTIYNKSSNHIYNPKTPLIIQRLIEKIPKM